MDLPEGCEFRGKFDFDMDRGIEPLSRIQAFTAKPTGRTQTP